MKSQDLLKFASTNNLNWIVHFHNHLKSLISEAVHEIDKSIASEDDVAKRKNLLHSKHVYENTFFKMLRNTVFLQMFSNFEETCHHLWKMLSPNTELERNHGITRYKPVFNELIDGGVGNLTHWELIREGEKIRHCLLHAYGRISLFKEKKEIERIVKKYNGEITIKQDRIQIESEFIERFAKNLTEITSLSIDCKEST